MSEYFLRDRVRGDAGRVAAERGKDPRDSAIAAVVRAINFKNLNYYFKYFNYFKNLN